MKIMEKKRTRTKNAIIKAAKYLISKHGFEETSMESIAERAGIAAGTLYNYYGSKSILLLAIFSDMTKQLAPQMPQASACEMTQDSALLDLTAVLQFLSLSTVLFPKAVMRQVFAQLFVLEPKDIADLVSLDMEIIGMLIPILNDMQQAGFLASDVNIEEAAMMLYGSAMLQHQAYITMEDMTTEQLNHAISSQVKMMFFGLLPR